jgi:hypothetical protein
MTTEPSKREFTRVSVELRAQMTVGDRAVAGSGAKNISMKGLLFETSEQLPVGTECDVVLFLGDGDIQIETQGNVVGLYADGIAVQFSKIMGIDSFEHLKNLVLYNAPDLEQVEHELDIHTGIRKKD